MNQYSFPSLDRTVPSRSQMDTAICSSQVYPNKAPYPYAMSGDTIFTKNTYIRFKILTDCRNHIVNHPNKNTAESEGDYC